MRHPVIVANWKMNMLRSQAQAFCAELRALFKSPLESVEIVIAPPFTALSEVASSVGEFFSLGAQNCHWEEKGAYTGEISCAMLAEFHCKYVLVGHSERREGFGETDEQVAAKIASATKSGLIPILCVGERWEERASSRIFEKLEAQLCKGLSKIGEESLFVIAYEPIWSIGTGRAPSKSEVEEVHGWIRATLTKMFGGKKGDSIRILYGGSVNSKNVNQFASSREVDGCLVGGASLKAQEFFAIARAFLP